MNVYRSFDEVPYQKNTILTVGTFDGVHRGHQIIIKRLSDLAAQKDLRAMILTLDPHPQIVLSKSIEPNVKLLTDIDERLALFEEFNLPNVMVIPFDYEFSRTTPEDFLRKYIHEKIGVSDILIGYDHMFGKNREGDLNLLERLQNELDFNIERIEALGSNNVIISSTKIRQALQSRDLKTATEMLGYPYNVRGQVELGDQRGRKIGYPTANIRIPNKYKLVPKNGVYFVQVEMGEQSKFGMANIGTRPTFTNDNDATLEVNIFDFDRDIYNEYITVSFLNYIRDEQKFNGVDEIVNQLKRDEDECHRIMKERHRTQQKIL